jgi:membrane protease YdiL (CAAX protease family)
MHPELSRVSAPNSESELYLEAYDQVYSAFIENLGLISIVALSLAAVWCLLLRGRKLFTSDIRQRREGMSFAKLMPLVALIFAIQFVSMVLSGALDALLQLLGQDQGAVNDSSDVLSGMVGTIGGFLYISLIGPFLEEVIFRGAAMRKLERHGANFAIITTSVLFAFYHLNFQQAIFTFMAGIVFAYAAGRYSLKWAWVLHVINNMFASVLMLTMEFWPPLTTAFTMAAFLLFLAGLVFSIIYLATHASLLRAQKRAGAPNVKGVFKKAWTSPAFLLYVIIATGLCVLMLLP